MKKAIALILICMMLVSTAACTCFKKIETQLSEVLHPSEKDSQDDAKATEEPKQNPEEQPESGAAEPEPTEEPKRAAHTVDNAVIVDNEYCKVTLVEGAKAANGDVSFRFLLENKTADKEQMFTMDDTAVNGWILSSLFIESVPAGKKANETLTFSASDLQAVGLTSVDKLTFQFRVYDSNDWSADDFVKDTFTVYPTGLSEAEIISPDRTKAKDEMVVVDNDSCAFVILGTYEDSFWGYTVSVYLENKTADKILMFSWDDVSVNGFMVDPFWASSVPAGSKKLSSIYFSSSKFEENGIKDVDEIAFELRVYDSENWMADDFVKDTFTYRTASGATAEQKPAETQKPTTGTSSYTDADIVGTWSISSAVSNGVTVPASMLGFEMSFTFKESGAAAMTYEGETTDGLSWALDGDVVKLSAYGIDLYDFQFDGSTLTLHEDTENVDLIFSK